MSRAALIGRGEIKRACGDAVWPNSYLAWLALCSSGCGSPRFQPAQTWNAYTYNSVATVTAGKGLVELFDEIGKRTDGELTIKLHLGGTLQIKATDITPAVADNIVQLGDDVFLLGSVPTGAVVRCRCWSTTGPNRQGLGDCAPALSDAYAKRGIIVVGEYVFPGAGDLVAEGTKDAQGYPGPKKSG